MTDHGSMMPMRSLLDRTVPMSRLGKRTRSAAGPPTSSSLTPSSTAASTAWWAGEPHQRAVCPQMSAVSVASGLTATAFRLGRSMATPAPTHASSSSQRRRAADGSRWYEAYTVTVKPSNPNG
jgi:hypothetical protein